MQKRFANLLGKADRLSRLKAHSLKQEADYAAVLGELLTLSDDGGFFQSISERQQRRLTHYARKAYSYLGGMVLPSFASVSKYDADRYGPFFAVSDEGSAAKRIRDAAVATPKAVALRDGDPMTIGMAIDAERMGASGEVPTGPLEYQKVRLAASRNLLTTTNVGVRSNIRYFQPRRIIRVRNIGSREASRRAVQSAKEYLAPYLNTPDGVPRPQVVLVQFGSNTPLQTKSTVLKELTRSLASGDIGDPKVHGIALLLRTSPRNALIELPALIRFAGSHGIEEVVYHSMVRPGADNQLSVAGLLNYFTVDEGNELLRIAADHGVKLTSQNQVDTNTVSRNTWVALNCSRRMGINLGKYGLFPLAFEEQEIVIRNIQQWMKHWDAIPAFYVDTPVVTEGKIYPIDEVDTSARRWLDMVAKLGVNVVLFDCPHRLKPLRLLRRDKSDETGVLTIEQLGDLDKYAKGLGIRILWAGGIAVQQVYELAAMGVFGIYTTSTTGTRVAAGPVIGEDPIVAHQVEPTLKGVMRVKVLIEAGFLSARAPGDSNRARISELSKQLIDSAVRNDQAAERIALGKLRKMLPGCWRDYWNQHTGSDAGR